MTDSVLSAREYFSKYNIGGIIFKNIISSVNSGENSLSQNLVAEALKSDFKWLDEVENALFSIEKICKSPQKFIISNAEVVNVEKARKTNSESIRHLSVHSNFIREIQDDGSVIPSKILTPFLEEDLMIHENRFIYTLITRMLTFLEARRSFVVENVGTFDTTSLNLNSHFNYGNTAADFEIKVKVKRPAGTAESITAERILSRIDMLIKRTQILKGTEFYKILSSTKPLVPPIAKTNLLMKHKDYSVCYKIWLLISSFTSVGYSVNISQESISINDDYFDDLTYIIGMTLKVILQNLDGKDSLVNENFIQKPQKVYNHITDFEYIPEFKDDLDGTEDDYINEFYYFKIKEVLETDNFLNRNTNDTANTFTVNNIVMPFTKFFRKLTNVNNKIFKEYLHFGLENNIIAYDYGSVEYFGEKLKQKEILLERYKLLERLKTIDLNETTRYQINIIGEIEQIKIRIDTIKKGIKDIKGK